MRSVQEFITGGDDTDGAGDAEPTTGISGACIALYP